MKSFAALPAGISVALAAVLTMSAHAADGPLATKKGSGGSEVQGSAGPGGSQGDNGQEKCDKPMGAMAVVEPQDYVSQSLSRYGLQSPTGIIRMMIQQSNCFIVVERGIGMQNMMQERALAESGELRQGSNMGGGQMVSADFVLTPGIVFQENNAGGIGGALGGLVGGSGGRALGAIAGGVKFKEAQTSMLVSDTRSGVQVAAAEGKAQKKDFRLGALGIGSGAAAAAGGYTNTNEGKVIAASFLDNYNRIVESMRSNTVLAKASGDDVVKAGTVFNEGDVVAAKIDNVKILAEAKDGSKVVGTVNKADDLVYLGHEKDGFLHVQGAAAEGWIKKTLITKR